TRRQAALRPRGSSRSQARSPPRNGAQAGHPSCVAAKLSKLKSFGRRKPFERVAYRYAANRLLEARQQSGLALAAIELEQQRLHGSHCRWRQRQCPIAEKDEGERSDRLPATLTATEYRTV